MPETAVRKAVADIEEVLAAASNEPSSVVDYIELPETYRPSAGEEFMNPRQLAYFRRRLLDWKDEILREARETLATLQSESLREPDVADRASSETDWSIELRTRDRQRKLIAKIDAALRRLEARPIATMTVEAQERHERNEKVSRED